MERARPLSSLCPPPARSGCLRGRIGLDRPRPKRLCPGPTPELFLPLLSRAGAGRLGPARAWPGPPLSDTFMPLSSLLHIPRARPGARRDVVAGWWLWPVLPLPSSPWKRDAHFAGVSPPPPSSSPESLSAWTRPRAPAHHFSWPQQPPLPPLREGRDHWSHSRCLSLCVRVWPQRSLSAPFYPYLAQSICCGLCRPAPHRPDVVLPISELPSDWTSGDVWITFSLVWWEIGASIRSATYFARYFVIGASGHTSCAGF